MKRKVKAELEDIYDEVRPHHVKDALQAVLDRQNPMVKRRRIGVKMCKCDLMNQLVERLREDYPILTKEGIQRLLFVGLDLGVCLTLELLNEIEDPEAEETSDGYTVH